MKGARERCGEEEVARGEWGYGAERGGRRHKAGQEPRQELHRLYQNEVRRAKLQLFPASNVNDSVLEV